MMIEIKYMASLKPWIDDEVAIPTVDCCNVKISHDHIKRADSTFCQVESFGVITRAMRCNSTRLVSISFSDPEHFQVLSCSLIVSTIIPNDTKRLKSCAFVT
jgi:hypothetical protein